MERSKTQYKRLLELDKKIRAGEFPNRSTFSQEWEVSIKTVGRDIEYMRDQLNAPIEFDKQKNGYFYTDLSWSRFVADKRDRAALNCALGGSAI